MANSRIVVKFNHFGELQRESPAKAGTALSRLCMDGVRDVKQSFGTSPSPEGGPPGVDTGALRNSIHMVNTGPFRREIRDGVEYGIYLEFGTVRMGARPFMHPMAQRLIERAPEFFRNFHKK